MIGIEDADRAGHLLPVLVDAVIETARAAIVTSGGLLVSDEMGIDPIEDRLTIVAREAMHGVSPESGKHRSPRDDISLVGKGPPADRQLMAKFGSNLERRLVARPGEASRAAINLAVECRNSLPLRSAHCQ